MKLCSLDLGWTIGKSTTYLHIKYISFFSFILLNEEHSSILTWDISQWIPMSITFWFGLIQFRLESFKLSDNLKENPLICVICNFCNMIKLCRMPIFPFITSFNPLRYFLKIRSYSNRYIHTILLEFEFNFSPTILKMYLIPLQSR